MALALHLLLALGLFYLVNWLGAHSRSFGYMQLSVALKTDEAPAFNFLLKTFAPAVLIILTSAGLYLAGWDSLVESIWGVALIYWLIRVIFNLLLARARLLNWPALLLQASLSTAAAYSVYVYWIVPKSRLLPTAEELTTELWLVVILFIYSALNNLRIGEGATERRKQRYIKSVLTRLRPEFDAIVVRNLPTYELKLIAYSIMLHENFNRPALARRLERLLGPRFVSSFGVMQISFSSRLSDEESVSRGVELILQSSRRHCPPGAEFGWGTVAQGIVADFNRDNEYIDEVIGLAIYLRDRRLLADLMTPEE